MRFAFVSDIHANLQAWNAVLESIRGQKIKHIINLGDVVGYGPSPKEVLKSVRLHTQVSVIGNHDAVCGGRMDPSAFNDLARGAIEWTQNQLNEEECQFFEDMAEKARPQGAGFLATHAEVVNPLEFSYILTEKDAKKNFAACEDQLIFIGHTHRAGIFVMEDSGEITIDSPDSVVCDPDKRYIINPGSVGDPRSEEIVASYCIYDTETSEITFHRVAFDIDAYRHTIEQSDLVERPFFIRFLDALKERGIKVSPTSITEEYTPPQINLNQKNPQINLSPQKPLVKEIIQKKKSRKPLMVVGTLTLLLGAGIWLSLTNSKKKAENLTSTKPADTTVKISPEKPAKLEEPLPIKVKPTIPKPQPLPRIPGTNELPTARYVRIVAPPGQPLVLAEVEVISENKNIARIKKVTQSSTRYKASYASRATDGISKGKNPNSLAYTRTDSPSWWEVDLGKDYPIDAINIWNRQASREVMRRLNGFVLILRNDQGETIYQMPQRVSAIKPLIKPWLKTPKLNPNRK